MDPTETDPSEVDQESQSAAGVESAEGCLSNTVSGTESQAVVLSKLTAPALFGRLTRDTELPPSAPSFATSLY